jgi:uncharacterized protein (DUF2141 family)
MFSAATKTGNGVSASTAVYVDDVFSTYLYTGTGASQTIVNNIALGNSTRQFSLKGYTFTNLGGAFDPSFPLSNINDGIAETTNGANIAYVANTSGYFDVYVDLVNPSIINAYNIAPQGTIGTAVYNTPTAFTVLASNNASSWTTITSFSSISTDYPNWNAGTYRAFSFSNTTAYRYWRIQCTTYGSGAAGVSISELNFTKTTNDTVYGGLVWVKNRSAAASHVLVDTVRGGGYYLSSDATTSQAYSSSVIPTFNSNGFNTGGAIDTSNNNYASWTFAKQPKFFDIVQYTGTGAAHAINHNLGSTPGCIMIKETSTINNWAVYHKGANGGTTPEQYYTVLNTTAAQVASSAWWNNTAPTSTQFTVGTNATVNASGQTYIAYIFASQAGGFGATGTDSAIACGNFNTDGSGNFSVNLGWEPQFFLYKCASSTEAWRTLDVMRGFGQTITNYLTPSSAAAESVLGAGYASPTATGITDPTSGLFLASQTYIYMAIRRPMKPPTTGTSVFTPQLGTVSSTPNTVTTGFPVDAVFSETNSSIVVSATVNDRLIGSSQTSSTYLFTGNAGTGGGSSFGFGLDNNTAIVDNFTNANLGSTGTATYWNFKRAPTFFDEVCYSGTGSSLTVNHNLTVSPELLIIKNRTGSFNWFVFPVSTLPTKYLVLNNDGTGAGSSGYLTSYSATNFVLPLSNQCNNTGNDYVAYLFATCAGVSKVGSFTGTGGTQTINCGFGSGGARFILIKRTDSTGNWYVFDSANGLTSGSSPYLTWNTANAQVTGNNGIFAASTGFTVNSTANATVNINGASYIFLAIA